MHLGTNPRVNFSLANPLRYWVLKSIFRILAIFCHFLALQHPRLPSKSQTTTESCSTTSLTTWDRPPSQRLACKPLEILALWLIFPFFASDGFRSGQNRDP